MHHRIFLIVHDIHFCVEKINCNLLTAKQLFEIGQVLKTPCKQTYTRKTGAKLKCHQSVVRLHANDTSQLIQLEPASSAMLWQMVPALALADWASKTYRKTGVMINSTQLTHVCHPGRSWSSLCSPFSDIPIGPSPLLPLNSGTISPLNYDKNNHCLRSKVPLIHLFSRYIMSFLFCAS